VACSDEPRLVVPTSDEDLRLLWRLCRTHHCYLALCKKEAWDEYRKRVVYIIE
jgi:hypothetical protein